MKRFLDMFRGENGQNYALPFALVSTLFLLWGFCNGMLDILNKHFQEALQISKAESSLVQSAHYLGYFCMAIPAGMFARRFGYKAGILVGLFLIALGAFGFVPATQVGTFGAFLTSLFVLATGLTVLETIANPYTTVLGPTAMGATRINLAQTFNAVGWILGPYVAGIFVFSEDGHSGNETLYIPYLIVGVVVAVLFVLFLFAKLPDVHAEEETKTAAAQTGTPGIDKPLASEAGVSYYRDQTGTPAIGKPLWQRKHFVLAVVAQFLYVAAQTGIFSYFVNYVTSVDMPRFGAAFAAHFPTVWSQLDDGGSLYHFTDRGASGLLAFGGFVLFLLGRMTGSLLLRVFPAHTTLGVFALVNAALMALIFIPLGWISVAALFLSFFFMSIMYPTIFALGIRGLGEHTKLASSIIVMAIVGGAIMPRFMGWLADAFSMRVGFLMPLLCFAYVMVYAFFWPKLEAKDAGADDAGNCGPCGCGGHH